MRSGSGFENRISAIHLRRLKQAEESKPLFLLPKTNNNHNRYYGEKQYIKVKNILTITILSACNTGKKAEFLPKKETGAMVDMNTVIAGNILALLKRQNKKQTDLAAAIGTNKQTVNKMLNGTRTINAAELKSIAEYLGVKMEELTKIPSGCADADAVHAFMGKVQSEQAKQALRIADELSDMILFHKKVRENGNTMMTAWEDD